VRSQVITTHPQCGFNLPADPWYVKCIISLDRLVRDKARRGLEQSRRRHGRHRDRLVGGVVHGARPAPARWTRHGERALGGALDHATVVSGAALSRCAGAVIATSGTETVSSGGSDARAALRGGHLNLLSGGTATAEVSRGTLFVALSSTASGIKVSSGWFELLSGHRQRHHPEPRARRTCSEVQRHRPARFATSRVPLIAATAGHPAMPQTAVCGSPVLCSASCCPAPDRS
jgi:hypothetical protein